MRDSSPAAAPQQDPLLGARVADRYRIDRIHARGGMSIVYAATYEAQQREVAIKVLDEAFAADAEAVERFEHEARTASSLSHGHVVGVSDYGRLPDGRPYLVMPMIMGKDLATVISEQGPMPATRVVTLLSGVASALDSMHAQGLVHRDIKSENIMYVRGDDGTESALVLDFGIAAVPSANGDWQTADLSGTPDFMAPEALAGEATDHRADVYSLATVAFELLTGRLPYHGNDLKDLLRSRARDKPRTLSEATRLSFHPALEAVFARGLARKPKHRPSSAGAFVRELHAAAAQARTSLAAPPGTQRLMRLRTLVGLPFTRPANANVSVKVQSKAPPAKLPPVRPGAPQSGVHRRPVAPEAPQREPSIVIDPSLWAERVQTVAPPVDSLRPLTDLDAELELPPARHAWLRFAVPGAAALAVLAFVLWSRASDERPTLATSPPKHAALPPAPALAPTPAPAPTAAPTPTPPPAPKSPSPSEASTKSSPRAKAKPVPPRAAAPAPRTSASAQELTQQGVDSMLRGDFAGALAKLDAATAASPRFAAAHRGRGLVLERMGRTSDAARAFRLYLRLEPSARDADKIKARLESLER